MYKDGPSAKGTLNYEENSSSMLSNSMQNTIDASVSVSTPNNRNVSPLIPSKIEHVFEPEDKGGVVNVIMLMWGFGVLLPWNAVLTMFDFLSDEMPGYQPAFVYPFAVNGLNAVTQLVVIIYGHKLSNRFKIQYMFAGAGMIMLALPIAARFLPSPASKFYSCFFLLMCFGVINGAVQGQVFGLGGLLPGKYMGSIMFGNGLSGIIMNLLRIIFILFLGEGTLYLQGQIFFVIAALILFLCAYQYDVLIKNPYFMFFKNKSSGEDQRSKDLRV